MNKKIIIVLIFFVMCAHSFADEKINFPELPSIEVENTLSHQEVSFWQKIKNFFGFGDVESKELNKIEIISPITDSGMVELDKNTLPSEVNLEKDALTTQEFTQIPLNDEKNMANKQNTQPDNNIISPLQDDVSSENKIANTTTTQDDKKNVIEDLKLPEGFDDDFDVKKNVQELGNSKDLNTGNVNNKEENNITKTEEITQLHIPNLDSVENKEIQTPEIISNSTFIDSKTVSDQNNPQNSAVPNTTTTIDSKTSLASPDKTAILVPSTSTAVTNQNINSKPEKIKNSTESLIPTYASETESKTDDSKILQYKTEFKSNKDKLKNITQISGKELMKNKKSLENNPEHIEFIKNEAQVLTLPDDEIVLGGITKDAEYELMDIRRYIDIFWNEYYKLAREPKTQELKQYIKNYNKNFNENY